MLEMPCHPHPAEISDIRYTISMRISRGPYPTVRPLSVSSRPQSLSYGASSANQHVRGAVEVPGT
jgi:hypothetical protein